MGKIEKSGRKVTTFINDQDISIILNKIMLAREEECEQNPQFSLVFLRNLRSGERMELKLEPNHYDSMLLFLLQECDRLGLHKRTKFLAKTYFDIVATQLSSINANNAALYLLTAILLAVKFNECRAISDYVNIQNLVNASEGQFQHVDFVEAEFQILKLLKFRLNYASPYEHAPNFSALIARYPFRKAQARLAKIEIIIDFALTLPSLMLLPPEEIYLACFLMIFEGALEKGDLEEVIRNVHDGAIVQEIRKEIEMRLGQMGNSGRTQKT